MPTVNRHASSVIVALSALAVFACGARTQPTGVDVKIPIAGLWTNPNDFDAPIGSLVQADNITQDEPGIWSPMRGYSLIEGAPSITGPIDEMVFFRGSLIVHHNTTSISRWTGTAWSTYSGSFTAPAQAAAGRVRFLVANESLFVTTSLGVYELDNPTTGTWRLTGAPKALDGTATLRRTVSETGFATAGGQWAYRWEWAFKNANNRLQVGAPSGRALLLSPASVVATTGQVAKATGGTTVTVSGPTHGYVTGEYVDVTLGGAETYFAPGTFQVTRVSDTSFTYSDAVNNASGISQSPGASITYGFTAGRGATLVIPIPAGITTDNFVIVSRSGKSASATTEPNDQLAETYERSPTNLEITAGSMTVTDISQDDFRGALIDIAGETILAAKYQPPVAADMAQYHNCCFYPATRGVQTLDLQLIAVGGTAGFQASDFLNFADRPDDPTSRTWVFGLFADTTETIGSGHFKLYTDGSAAQNIANTARSIVRVVNGWSSNTTIYAEYVSGDQEAPGKMRFYGRTPAIGRFGPFINTPGSLISATAFIPQLATAIGITDIARSGTTVTVNSNGSHGYASGQIVQLFFSSNTSHFPNGLKTVTVVDANTFTYVEAGSTVTAEGNGGFFASEPLDDAASDIIYRTDRIAYSLPDRPWSVPLPNELFIDGEPTTSSNSSPTVHRLVATRDRLYVLADSGLYQVTGYYPDFAITDIQRPLKLLAPESAVSTGAPGRVYGLTDQGEMEVMTAATPVSGAIQNIFQALQASAPAAVKNYGFSVAYPSDFKVLVFLPEASTDTKATNAYVFHMRTGEWTRWDIDATAGAVDPVTDKLYLGTSSGAVWVERKTRTLADYYLPVAVGTGTSFAYSAKTSTSLTVTSTAAFTVGDTITGNGNSTIVTAITDGTHLAVASTSGFTTAPSTATRDVGPISCTATGTRWFGKEGPDVDKDITSGMVLVQPPASSPEFVAFGLSFANDYNPTFSTPETLTLNSVMSSQLPFRVPTDMQRSGWLQWKLTHSPSVGGEKFKLLGLSLGSKAVGLKEGF